MHGNALLVSLPERPAEIGQDGEAEGEGVELGDAGEPPIAEAKALLAKYPRYAQWVQNGWAGGGNGQYYRNDPTKYWPHEIEAKMAPVVAAAAQPPHTFCCY